jgi:hypothetical protein
MSSIPPRDSHLCMRVASDQLCNFRDRPTHGLTCAKAERRFGVSRVVIANLCRRAPGLAVKAPALGSLGLHWVIDPPRLEQVLGEALDPVQLARRLGMAVEAFAALDPPHRAMLAALLTPRPDRRRKRPAPRLSERAEVVHEQR